ncbi:cytochrome subunit of sulfide dehydrogenase [Burkholderiales bacterium]|nr:cytochrome subunit of sulfide dehydrogenase [Burkholderiales bacterium]
MRNLITAMALVAAAAPAIAQAPDAALARNLAATCANCHGTNGMTQGTDVEPLAGKPKDELVRKVQEFKQGKKPGTIMPQLAKGLTDAQIELMAGWFAAQPAK